MGDTEQHMRRAGGQEQSQRIRPSHPRGRRSTRRRSRLPLRRRLRLEPLEDRWLLAAATDLAAIAGLVFDDRTGNGFDAGEQVAGATLNLYRDNGNGLFDPAAGDALVRTTTTDSAGRYRFDALTAGSYFVEQPAQAVGGDVLQQRVGPLLPITSADATGRLLTTIDSFDATTQSVVDNTGDGVPVTSSIAAPEAIGGERDLAVNKTSVNGAVQISVDDPLLPGLFTFDSILTGQGTRSVSWDGVDRTALVIDDDGLSNTDITSAGAASGLRLQIGADLEGGTATIRIYSNDGAAGTANRFSSVEVAIPATGGFPSAVEYIPFSAFTATSGGGADLTQVGAIEMEITGVPNVNGAAELVGAVGPTVLTQDFSNFETADLRLDKTVSNPDPNVGQNVLFTITATNDGPDLASGVAVTDQLPPGMTLVSATPSQGTYDSATGVWTVGSLGNRTTASLQIVATVTTAGAKTNVAQVTASEVFDPDSTPGNSLPAEDDQASATLTPQAADLSLLKTVDDASPDVGQNVLFTVAVANAGPDTATGVAVTDRLPAGLTFISASPSRGTFDNASGIWSIGNLNSGGGATLQLVARVNAVAAVNNTAQITAADQFDVDSTPGNNVGSEDDQASVTVTPTAIDLSLAKTVSDDRPNLNQTVTYTLSLANAGPNTATGVAVSDPLPAGVTFLSSVPSQGAYDAATGIWTVGNVASSAGATLQLLVRVDTAGAKLNVAEVSTADQFDVDSTPANGVAGEDDRAAVLLTPAQADLSLTKSVDDPTPNVGQNVTYSVAISNAGPDTASGVTVRDPLPAGVTFVSSAPGQGSYDNATGVWTVGTLAAGATATLQVTATASAATAASAVTNAAEVETSDQLDPDSTPGNGVAGEDDRATATITPELVDLALTKMASDAAPNVGQTVTFTINVNNAGPSTATGVVVGDSLSEGLTFVSAAPSQGSFDGGTGVWTVGNIASGASATLQLVARATSVGTLWNTAEVTAADQVDADSIPGNDAPEEDDRATTVVVTPIADLSLSKAVDNPSPQRDDVIQFRLTLVNAGPSTGENIIVRDTLPAGLRYVSSTSSQGVYDPDTGRWTVGDLSTDAAATLVIDVAATAAGPMTNTAEVLAADQFDPDSTPGNNLAGEDDIASVTVTPVIADLAVGVVVDDETPALGDAVTLQYSVTNSGPSDASGIAARIDLPAGWTLVSTAPDQGTFDPATGIWTLGSLAVGQTRTLRVVATVDTFGFKSTGIEIVQVDQLDPDSTPGNALEGEDDQAALVIQAPRKLSLRQFMAR